MRRECRADLLTWCTEALAPLGLKPASHHRLLIEKLEAVYRGKIPRLQVNMPPGGAKSTYTSVLFPAWVLAQRAGFDMIGASNTATMAEDFSRRIIGMIRDHPRTLGYSLTRESAEKWETTNRGRYRAAGVGGAIAGTRADGALIDDPIRSREDAESENNREKQWAWFMSDLRTRLKPNAWIVLIMTRWHADDLGGRALERQPGLWEVISLPAQAVEDDPLGRLIGDFLWSDDDYGYGDELKRVKAEYEEAGAMRDWNALYQQDPRPGEGALFKVSQIEVIDAIPHDIVADARGWDLAATKQVGTNNPDWTAGVRLMRQRSGRYIIANVTRDRGGPDDVESMIVNTASQDGQHVRVGLPIDPGQASKTQVLYLTRKLAGYRVESSPESGDKATRAAPVASQLNVGNVAMMRGTWNAALIDELASFPSGVKDDQVDALSRAFSMIGLSSGMLKITDDMIARMGRRL